MCPKTYNVYCSFYKCAPQTYNVYSNAFKYVPMHTTYTVSLINVSLEIQHLLRPYKPVPQTYNV